MVHRARVEISAAGSVDDVTEADKVEIANVIALSAGVAPTSVSVNVVAASVLIIAEIITASADDANSAMVKLQQDMSTPEATTAMLSSASIEVISAPVVMTVATSEPMQLAPVDTSLDATASAQTAASGGGGGGGMVFGAIGAVVVLGGLCIYCRYCRGPRKSTRASYDLGGGSTGSTQVRRGSFIGLVGGLGFVPDRNSASPESSPVGGSSRSLFSSRSSRSNSRTRITVVQPTMARRQSAIGGMLAGYGRRPSMAAAPPPGGAGQVQLTQNSAAIQRARSASGGMSASPQTPRPTTPRAPAGGRRPSISVKDAASIEHMGRVAETTANPLKKDFARNRRLSASFDDIGAAAMAQEEPQEEDVSPGASTTPAGKRALERARRGRSGGRRDGECVEWCSECDPVSAASAVGILPSPLSSHRNSAGSSSSDLVSSDVADTPGLEGSGGKATMARVDDASSVLAGRKTSRGGTERKTSRSGTERKPSLGDRRPSRGGDGRRPSKGGNDERRPSLGDRVGGMLKSPSLSALNKSLSFDLKAEPMTKSLSFGTGSGLTMEAVDPEAPPMAKSLSFEARSHEISRPGRLESAIGDAGPSGSVPITVTEGHFSHDDLLSDAEKDDGKEDLAFV